MTLSTQVSFSILDLSNCKFKIIARSYQDTIKFQGDTDKPQTSINVFRLGDT